MGRSLPRMAAGAIVYAQTDACATLQAVQVEAISPDGQRLDRTGRPDPWRQNYGSKAGAFFQADRMAPRGLVLCEGPVDALAALWLYPGWSAWATCGTAGLKSIDGRHFARAGWPVGDPITIVSDPGYPGQEAAMTAEHTLSAAGLAVALDMRHDGQGDLADELKASIQGKMDEGESLTRAWELFLGERTHKSPGSG